MRRIAPNKKKALELVYRPWPLFIIFLAANSLLAYCVLALQIQMWIACLGLFLPTLVSLRLILSEKSRPVSEKDLSDPPAGLWFLLAGLILTAYFYRLGSFPSWPIPDEGRYAYFALDVAQKWDGRMLWGESQGLPLSFWVYGFLLKWIPFSFFTMRLLPTFFSLLAIGFGFWFSRKFFNRSFSFIFIWILALSFWAFSLSRFFMFMSLFLFLEIVSLGFLFLLMEAPKDGAKLKYSLLLSAATASAFYTALIGKTLLAVVGLTLFFHFIFIRPKDKKFLFLFMALCGGLIAPLLFTEAAPGGASYMASQLNHGLNFDYFIGLFWNGFQSAPAGPNWGGCLNSILGSLVPIGLLEWLRRRRLKLLFWWLASFVLFLLAGLLSKGVEMYRVLTVLPLLLLGSAEGLRVLASSLPRRWAWAAASVLLLGSSAMDLYHYTGPYQDLPGRQSKWKNTDFEKIDGLLQSESHQGVSLALFDFTTNYDDHTLEVMTYPLNAILNPRLDFNQVQEAAVICHPDYERFLHREFPRGRWTWVVDPSFHNSGLLLGLIPVDETTRPLFERWRDADITIHQVKALYMYYQPGQPRQPIGNFLMSRYPLFEGNPFLESVFWDQMGLGYIIEKDLPEAEKCYQTGIRRGYPAGHLYNNLGISLALAGRLEAAKAAFAMAVRASGAQTEAGENLKKTEALKGTGPAKAP